MKPFYLLLDHHLTRICLTTTLLMLAPGCPFPGSTPSGAGTGSSSADTTPAAATATATVAAALPTVITGTPRSAKIIFKQAYPNGSFDSAPISGTVNSPGHGLQISRVFNADGSLLSNGLGSATWPKWLSGFEIGVSGANNSAATNGACAKFADATEAARTNNCHFHTQDTGCGASNGFYRVSEIDCLQSTAATPGTGGPTDGIYFRAYFDRSQLGTAENLMAVFEYVAASYNGAPSAPKDCLKNGQFTPESCSDVTWKAFIKHSANEMVQPFLLLVPPNQNFTDAAVTTSGVNPTARQFFIPIASDPSITVLQISRINSALNIGDPAVQLACSNNSLPANSPLCAGMILYSLTLYRM
ncbi:hypothetical protein WDW37_10315 [Bdellovibrionota bacterium FG-1]